MKVIRQIGSLAFVLGLFTVIFAGVPWHVVVSDDPVIPWWLRIAVFALLGGILVVLLTVALEQRKFKTSPEAPSAAPDPQNCLNARSPRFSVSSRATPYLPSGLAKTSPPWSDLSLAAS
jgi:hypothetical protein